MKINPVIFGIMNILHLKMTNLCIAIWFQPKQDYVKNRRDN